MPTGILTRHFRFRLPVYLLMAVLAGCSARKPALPPASADTSGQEISQETLRTLIVSLNKRYEDVDDRIVENSRRLEALEREVASLRTALRASATLPPPSKTSPPAPAAAKAKGKSASTGPSPPDERKLYQGAFKAYSRGEYREAISRFEEFLAAFPSSDLADNALYWIGECYYGNEDFERAVSAWLKLVDRYPLGNKVADALYKIGVSYGHLKNPQKAREFLTRVMDNYPFSDAAAKAKTRLDELE
ncbi:MAG: tol-pal system protein YbgF [Deltaproteobacteria bacterium]|nr:tol-pal system protein YbgF [Deltaproteobacteria bacterium]